MKTIKFLFLSLFLLSFMGMSAQTYYFTAPQGYGAATTGGGSGTVTIVTTKAQLQTALTASGSGVVIVQGSVQCDYLTVLVTNKTLLGLPGANLYTNDQTAGASGILNLKPGSNNVIIRNLIFIGPGAYDSDGRDCLTNSGTNIWVDHCEFQDGMDGNFDNKDECDNVTVSWCKFTYLKTPKAGGSGGTDDHRFSNLVGSSSSDYPSDKQFSITWQYCWWAEGCKERMVRARNAQLHMLNCYWNSSVANKCLGLEDGSNGNGTQVYLEGGVFETPSTTKNIDVSYGGTPDVTVVDCVGSSLANNSTTVSKPSYTYTALSSSLVKAAITSSCGAGATLNVTTAGVISSSCSGSTTVAVTGVSLSSTAVSLAVGGTSQLTATVAPTTATNKTVSYSSSNTAVATVSSSGLVTAVAAGSATITVTTADGSKTATCAVTVTSTTVAVTGVTVSPTSSTITSAGGTIQLTATVAPTTATNKAVTWTSSNTSVATVSSTGLVTAIANGTATITVTTQDGSKTATSAITVSISTTTTTYVHNFTTSGTSSSYYTISGNLSTSKGTVTYSGLTLTQCLKMESATSIKFTATQAGVLTLVFNSTYTSGISVDGATSANATAGVLSISIAAGTHTLTKSASANLYYMSLTYGATKSLLAGTELSENNSKSEIKLFPNPVKDVLTIELNKELAGAALIQLFDNAGKLIVTKEVEGANQTLDMSNLRSGVYIVKISNSSEIVTKRIVKQ